MKQEYVKPWVDALRSGKYKQTIGNLNTCEGFCCLGVLTDVAIKNGWVDGEWQDVYEEGEDLAQYGVKAFKGQKYVLPSLVQAVVKIKSTDGKFNVPGASLSSLVDVNDGGLTFDQIADLIEYFADDL